MGLIYRKAFARIARNSFFEFFILFILAIVVTGYIVFLKTSTRQKTVFVEASIQPSQWWLSSSTIPTRLLSGIREGSSDRLKRLTVISIRFFSDELKDWHRNDDRSVGIVQFKIVADEQRGKLFYKDQELLIGNPLVVEVNQTRLELLITKIENKEIVNDYQTVSIVVKYYSKHKEFLEYFRSGMQLKDNSGNTYGTIVSLVKEPSRIAISDQWGNLLLRRDPIVIDMVVTVDVLAKKAGNRIVSYDGQSLAVGSRFFFSDLFLQASDGWIIDIKEK